MNLLSWFMMLLATTYIVIIERDITVCEKCGDVDKMIDTYTIHRLNCSALT